VKIYIAGPMSGLPDYNFPAFHEAAYGLRLLHHDPLNPATSFDGRQDLEYEMYIREAVRMVAAADAILMLPNWQSSKGARMELHVACTIGMPTFVQNDTWSAFPVLEPREYKPFDVAMNLVCEHLGIPDHIEGVSITWGEENEDCSVGEDEVGEINASTGVGEAVSEYLSALVRGPHS
jgi:hypothetical protein